MSRIIFVFGSNLAGRHGRGAAREAHLHWGAIYGKGIGLVGNSYAIPTKDESLRSLSLKQISRHIQVFLEFAQLHPELRFHLTRVACGLAGYTDAQIAPMFSGAPVNCHLPGEWITILRSSTTLFQLGEFTLHSGMQSAWKIDCDALTDTDIATLAVMLKEILPAFGSVEGIPHGGLRLAAALAAFATGGPILIVDDVLTTGRSMEEQRNGRDAIGAVIFARAACPKWITPLFMLSMKL